MKNLSFLFMAILVFTGCQNKTQFDKESNTWANAKWIAYEQLDNSMKVVPGVHGSGNELGQKAVKRSVVPMFRKEFSVAENIEKATISISGLGHYELHLNGEKVGDHFLAPGWTSYEKRIFYNTYDITT